MTGHPVKPTPEGLGVDLAALEWERSGAGEGSIEVAFPLGPASGPATWERGEWVLMRVAGDPAGRVLVFDRNEWACFLDGVRNGEFDDAASALAGWRQRIRERVTLAIRVFTAQANMAFAVKGAICDAGWRWPDDSLREVQSSTMQSLDL